MAKTPKKIATGKTMKAETKTEYVLSKSMVARLPLAERETASSDLWKKSGGVCALCGNALDLHSPDSIVPDHRIPDAKGGKTELANLYLAHRTCNSSRQHLDFEVAQPLAKFQSIAAHKGVVDFDDVLDVFVPGNRKPVTFEVLADHKVQLSFGSANQTLPLWKDPATGVSYFFAEIPVEYIHNDTDIQPRNIMPLHVRKLALDFLERPVHEPSNCRAVASQKSARLLQFDGQHKTTAQILLGRKSLQMKVYVEPSIDMLQSLVIKIQQEIKKQPLTRSDTLAKINDVIQRYVNGYQEPEGKLRTERGLIASQKKEDQKVVKQLYFDDLMGIVFFDEDNELSLAVKPGTKDAPATDKIVIQKIIAPLMYSQPLDVDLDQSQARDVERQNILFILNSISQFMLPTGWNKPGNEKQRQRAQNFFYQGSIGWWMNEILVPALRYVLMKIGEKTPLLIEEMDETQRSYVLTLIETLCSWPIWTTDDPAALKAMRSNTVKNVIEVFPGYTYERLVRAIK